MTLNQLSDVERIVALEVDTKNIKDDVHEIKTKVNDLHDAYMQAKGAKWMFIVFWMVAGGLLSNISNIVSFFKSH